MIIGVIAWQGYDTYRQHLPKLDIFSSKAIERTSQPATANSHSKVYTDIRLPERAPQRIASEQNIRSQPISYRCDGRTYCSQMNSCEEATWFLKNCPGTKMDGDNDGIPCERQWCN